MASPLYGTLRMDNPFPTADNGTEGTTVVESLIQNKRRNPGNLLDFLLSLVSPLDVKSCFQDSKMAEDSLKRHLRFFEKLLK